MRVDVGFRMSDFSDAGGIWDLKSEI